MKAKCGWKCKKSWRATKNRYFYLVSKLNRTDIGLIILYFNRSITQARVWGGLLKRPLWLESRIVWLSTEHDQNKPSSLFRRVTKNKIVLDLSCQMADGVDKGKTRSMKLFWVISNNQQGKGQRIPYRSSRTLPLYASHKNFQKHST